MSIGTKKKDKDNKESPGGEASADYMIEAAATGKSNTSDAASGSATGSTTADKITRNDEGTSTRKEKITSTSRSSQDEIPTESTNTTTISATTEFATSPSYMQQRDQQQHSVNRALDQTRDNIRRATDEARKDIPRYTQAVSEYQEQTIQAAKEIADNYIEVQKQIINSLQSAWVPQIESANRVFNASWVSPRHLADNYARVLSALPDSTMAATRLTNNTMLSNIEAFKTSMQQAKDNAKELSRIGVNAARSFEQTLSSSSSRDTTITTTTNSPP